MRDERGEIAHFIAVKQDITERKQAEAKRKQYSRKLQVLSRRLVDTMDS